MIDEKIIVIYDDDESYAKCSGCGYPIDDDRWCPGCDANLRIYMEEGECFCRKCNHAVDIDDSKCWYCSRSLTR